MAGIAFGCYLILCWIVWKAQGEEAQKAILAGAETEENKDDKPWVKTGGFLLFLFFLPVVELAIVPYCLFHWMKRTWNRIPWVRRREQRKSIEEACRSWNSAMEGLGLEERVSVHDVVYDENPGGTARIVIRGVECPEKSEWHKMTETIKKLVEEGKLN